MTTVTLGGALIIYPPVDYGTRYGKPRASEKLPRKAKKAMRAHFRQWLRAIDQLGCGIAATAGRES